MKSNAPLPLSFSFSRFVTKIETQTREREQESKSENAISALSAIGTPRQIRAAEVSTASPGGMVSRVKHEEREKYALLWGWQMAPEGVIETT